MKGKVVECFVKNLKVHKYPAPGNYRVKHAGEKLYDKPPSGYARNVIASLSCRDKSSSGNVLSRLLHKGSLKPCIP